MQEMTKSIFGYDAMVQLTQIPIVCLLFKEAESKIVFRDRRVQTSATCCWPASSMLTVFTTSSRWVRISGSWRPM